MNTRRMLASALRALGRNKLRTGFMMLGTLIGVTALTVVVALGQGTQQQVLDTFRRIFGGSTILVQAVAASHSGMVQSGVRTTLTLDDVAALEAEVPDVRVIDPGQFIPAADLVFEGNAVKTTVRGHSEHHEAAWNRGVTRGAFITDQHVRASARVALVGETVVERVFAEVDPIGQTIRIGTVPFEVIGVLAPIGLDPHGVDRDNEIIVPITTMMRRVMNVDHLLSARIVLDPDADLEAAVGVVRTILRTRHRLADGEPDDFQTWTPVQVERMVEAGNRVFTVLLPLVALLSIVVGAGVVANVMLMSVGQRKHEIGLRKAVGARPRDIWWQFVFESALVTTLGGLIAVGLGFAALAVITTHTAAVAGFPWGVTLLGMGVAVGVGILAGVAPANRAARLDPVDSLR